jgi:hypothetical protein
MGSPSRLVSSRPRSLRCKGGGRTPSGGDPLRWSRARRLRFRRRRPAIGGWRRRCCFHHPHPRRERCPTERLRREEARRRLDRTQESGTGPTPESSCNLGSSLPHRSGGRQAAYQAGKYQIRRAPRYRTDGRCAFVRRRDVAAARDRSPSFEARRPGFRSRWQRCPVVRASTPSRWRRYRARGYREALPCRWRRRLRARDHISATRAATSAAAETERASGAPCPAHWAPKPASCAAFPAAWSAFPRS